MTVCIYTLIDPRTSKRRYVGKTSQKLTYRLKQHLASAQKGNNTHLLAWLRELLGMRFEPEIEILETLQDGEDWQERERFWIAHGKVELWPLTNATIGGEGIIDPSPELRRSRSERMKGNKYSVGNTNATGKRSPEFRARMAEVAKQTKNALGHVLSEEARQRISEKLMGHETVKGEENGQSKLTEEQVKIIREMYAIGGVSYRSIAQLFNVNHECIHRVVKRLAWKHVK